MAGRGAEAVGHLAAVLTDHPDDAETQRLMTKALSGGSTKPEQSSSTPSPPSASIDWSQYENELEAVVPPRFVRSSGGPDAVESEAGRPTDVEQPTSTLNDVGGLKEVKKRLEIAFFVPMRNDKLRALFSKSLRGGLLLYGPPGCGKTFLARAVAGEMGARFMSLSITDVLSVWLGEAEWNLHTFFERARTAAPCVVFIDELDALGHRRSQLTSSSLRTLGNQLLTELDGVDQKNDGLFVLAATNAPWDVDAALRRPGRLDRTVLVPPPDADAREAILAVHLRGRPIANVDLRALAAATSQFSGADLAHVCETAAGIAMHESITTGTVRMIEQRDLHAAIAEIQPSTLSWMQAARNVVMFGNGDGTYNDLAAYLRKRKGR
ncbi:ATP-binding protein [Ruania rhizosphaerae]|uniref:ATP-binding protein n=1 Tax=Ruania rhizosphaerae TaxID=1840413 RepID=UPI001F1841B3|nr:ATP-binding protein [Ruania rhizosphaerae]